MRGNAQRSCLLVVVLMFIGQSEAMSNMTVSQKLDKMGGQIMKLLDGQNQTNSKLSLLAKMMEAMKNFTGPGGFPPKGCYKCGMVCEMESGTVGVCQEDKSCSQEVPDCLIGGSDDCECGKPCKTSDGTLGLCQKDKTCSAMFDSRGGFAYGSKPDCGPPGPPGPHTGKPHTGKPHTGRPPTDEPPTDKPEVTKPTPVNGVWGKWSAYSKCSRTCGAGTRVRRRACNAPPPKYGGRPCPGTSVQTGRCTSKACVSKPTAACVDRYPPNVPCKGTFSCINLAKRRACNKRFSQALPKWCSAKVNIRYRNQLVKSYCRKSCKLCRVG